jgi:uncharacterized membrane protein (DUF373 family)
MNKFNKHLITFLKYFSPVVAVAIFLSMRGFNGNNFFYQFFGLGTILWTVLLFYFFFAVAFSENLKNTFVRRLAGIKENDEREFQLTGIVSKKTFIATTAFLILLLFLSVIRVNIYRDSEAEVKSGKHGTIQIGMGMTILNEKTEPAKEEIGRRYIIKYNGFPLSADGTLLLVMLLQLGTFYYFSRQVV